MTSTIQSLSSQAGNPLWILETRHTAYVFGIDTFGYLQHVYWGPKLVTVEDYEDPEAYHETRHFERSPAYTREEFPAWGGYSYVEPCIKAQFDDGGRAVVLQYTKSLVRQEGDMEELVIYLQDPVYPLSVQLIYRPIPDYDLIERSVVLSNTGDLPITLEQVMTANWNFPRRSSYRLRSLGGKWGGEFQISDSDILLGKHVIERRRGASGFDSNPWFAISATGSTETDGEVWFGALAFSGNYKLVVERTAYEHLSLTGGINDFDFAWHLDGGERFETPTFVAGYTEQGFGSASRLLHDYQLKHILAPVMVQTPRPVVYNSWYVTFFDVTVENQIEAAKKAKALGVEVFIMDDGWFSTRDHDNAGLGDWEPAPHKFPDGLGPLIQQINAMGMKFGIWVEPEMVNPDSDLYRSHPDWVYHFANRERNEGRNQLVLNFSRDDVQAFAFGFLDKLLSENNIDYVKWDMNRHFSEAGWPDAPPGREREIWVRHTRGVYNILQRLREKHPHVMIESCSGGGGRVDLGIMPYADLFWESDNTDPYDDLFMFEGFSQAYPALTRMRLVTDPIHINQNRKTSVDYAFHVAMMGMLGIGADILQWSPQEFQQAQSLIAQYKDLRETIQYGHLYRLHSPRQGDVTAYQFVHQDGHEAVIFVYLHASRFGDMRSMLRLHGLDAQDLYRIEGDKRTISGQALMKRGLHLSLSGDYVSQLIVIRRL